MDQNNIENYEAIFHHYQFLLSEDITEYSSHRKQLQLPLIPPPIMTSILRDSISIFRDEPMIIRTTGPVIIVGDLHGQILDLLRILKSEGLPPEKRYIFLGDLVDRGQFSTETVTLIFIMKILWPGSIILLRGNHEFDELCTIGGFGTEISNIYNSDDISSLFSYSFACIPIACIVNNIIVCLHGGIGPTVKRLSTIEDTQRPLYIFPDGPITDILWSDPSEMVDTFKTSSRGSGALFGQKAIDNFLQQEKLEFIVRGHQCVATGVASSLNGKCITVFSASNYCGVSGNKAGVLLINEEGNMLHKDFDPLPLLFRMEAKFLNSKSQTSFVLNFDVSQLPMIDVNRSEEKHRGTARPARCVKSSLITKKPEPSCHTGRDEVRAPLVLKKPPIQSSTSLKKKIKNDKLRPPVPLPSLRKTTPF